MDINEVALEPSEFSIVSGRRVLYKITFILAGSTLVPLYWTVNPRTRNSWGSSLIVVGVVSQDYFEMSQMICFLRELTTKSST